MTLPPSIEALIQRGIDGELSTEERARLDLYLSVHPDAAEQYQALRRQSELLSRAVPTPSAAHLRELRNRAARSPATGVRLAASIAIFAVGLGLGYALPSGRTSAPSDLVAFARDAEAAHALYVSEVLHPVEVGASQKDHLQTWLSNRLGSAIIAPQLGDSGFTLIGGRLLPAGERASALFMYENAEGDRLSLLATHGPSTKSQSFRFQEDGGYLTVYWQDGPWQYSLVGDQPRDPMNQIARLVHGQMI